MVLPQDRVVHRLEQHEEENKETGVIRTWRNYFRPQILGELSKAEVTGRSTKVGIRNKQMIFAMSSIIRDPDIRADVPC